MPSFPVLLIDVVANSVGQFIPASFHQRINNLTILFCLYGNLTQELMYALQM